MDNPLTRKLQTYVRLTGADTDRLADALGPARRIGARIDIVAEGDDPRAVNVVLDGWAGRYKQFADGRRQIVSLLLPGDTCDPNIFLLERMDHAIIALTPVTLAQISGRTMQDLRSRSETLEEAFHREMLAVAAIQREWTVSLGRRSALERLAHLLCELHLRQATIGLADGPSCPMPLTQPDLADALGQTSVHINRTLQDLRRAGLVALRSRRLTLLDPDRLWSLAQFDPTYLHHTRDHAGAGVRPREADPAAARPAVRL
ncbi:Crp/Fnr family transcriptional regulator [Methylobacterium sp. NEAU 140]|uniref:Crp/Fnr family transcriptional regulator n=1 Tax=Methylobacterium sp. NEAU 140 TaxID=3064945 RepID=UPI0027371A9A|nr:Crp/Fnr family transcriptional regulator [Methylobacterium sp. NEAU 140]MDP4021475.1 Crp/Fnr family transcriptional regulator [Methylobacterium sp. NEAU 140]